MQKELEEGVSQKETRLVSGSVAMTSGLVSAMMSGLVTMRRGL